MIRWKKMRREPLPNETILSFLNGEEFVLQDLLAENKNALFYAVRSQTTGQAVVLKEFFNSHWVRLRGAPALKGWEQEPPDSRKLSRTYLWLRRQAEQEQRMNQELCGSVRCVIPEKPVLPAGYAAPAGRHRMAVALLCLSGNGRHDRSAGLPVAGADAGMHQL